MAKIKRRFDFDKNKSKHIEAETAKDDKSSLEDINSSIQTGQVLQEGMFAPVYSSQGSEGNNEAEGGSAGYSRAGGSDSGRRKITRPGKNSKGAGETAGLEYEQLAPTEPTPSNNKLSKEARQSGRSSGKPSKARDLRQYGSREFNKHRVGFFGVMLEDFLNKMTGGNLDVQQSSFEIAYNRIMAEKHTKMIFQIIGLPMEGVKPGFIEDMRGRLRDRFPASERGNVNLYVVEHTRNNHQNLSSRKNKSNEAILEKQYRAFEEELKVMRDPHLGISESIREEAKEDRLLWSSIESSRANRDEIAAVELKMKKIRRKQQTYEIIQQFQAADGHCCDYFIFLEIIVKKPELLELAADYMKEILESLKMEYKPILDLNNYQKSFGVASMKVPDKKSKFDVIPFLTTSNIAAISTNFRPGIIRDKVCELYMGNQIANNYRFDIGLTATGKAENMMMFAQTGAGKSVFVATSLLTAMDNPYMNMIIKDYKGGEYAPFASVFPDDATVISTGIRTGSYMNTYVIPDYRKFGFDTPITAFLLASNITIKTLTALASRSRESEKYVQDVCTDIVDKVYRIVGVRQQEPSTYSRSVSIDYVKHTMYALHELMRDSDVRNKYSQDILNEVHTALVPHFGYEGIKGGLYRRPVNLEKILFNNRIIICDKGAQSIGGSQSLSESELRAQSLQEFYIDNLFTSINRMNGNSTIIVTEEIQQRLEDELLLSELVSLFSGGRSSNIINIGISSTAAAIFENESPKMKAVRESLTGLIIGRCDSAVVETLVQNTKISNIYDSLMRVSRGKGAYEHSFLYYSLTGKVDAVVTRMPVNQQFVEKLLRNKTLRKSDYNFKY